MAYKDTNENFTKRFWGAGWLTPPVSGQFSTHSGTSKAFLYFLVTESHNKIMRKLQAPPMKHRLEAIPTLYAGIQFKSRLEARFAEWLDNHGFHWTYEPCRLGENGYKPDFFVEEGAVYVEVKPEPHLNELDVFRKDINWINSPWICVDLMARNRWQLMQYNVDAMGQSFFESEGNGAILEAYQLEDGQPRLSITNIPRIILNGYINAPVEDPKDPKNQPASDETAREHFARMRALLEACDSETAA
jgi:hypothetical protein